MKLTKAQREVLHMIIRHENDVVPVRAYGKTQKPLYALLDSGLAVRQPDGRWIPTDAGRTVAAR